MVFMEKYVGGENTTFENKTVTNELSRVNIQVGADKRKICELWKSLSSDKPVEEEDLVVASILDKFKIAYRYKSKISLEDGTVLEPRFLCLDFWKKRFVVVERCGHKDMNNLSYVLTHSGKYLEVGFTPRVDFIAIYDPEWSPVTEEDITKALLYNGIAKISKPRRKKKKKVEKTGLRIRF